MPFRAGGIEGQYRRRDRRPAEKGQAAAQKKAARQATEGLVGHYIHAGGKIGVIIEVNCESDFVARTEDFQRLCHDVAMHIAALDTRYVRREDVTQEILDREREIYMAQARATGKPEPVIEKIVNGKMEKFYEENCLYEQHFIKDESVTVGELVSQMIHKLGENISIRRYVRFKVGETRGSVQRAARCRCRARELSGCLQVCGIEMTRMNTRFRAACGYFSPDSAAGDQILLKCPPRA